MMKRNHIRWAWLPIAALAALWVFTSSCSHNSSSGGDSASAGNAVAEVTATRIVRADISQMLPITGGIVAMPNRDVKVSAQVAGRVTELGVAEGDAVRQGQVVAQLDDRLYQAQLRQAQAAADQAKASLENAKLSLQRNQDLFTRGIAARKDLEDAQTQESVAAGAVEQANAALSLAQLQVARTKVTSPLSGIVVKTFASVGEQVDGTAAQPLVEIASLEEVEIDVSVPAGDLQLLRTGQKLDFVSAAAPGRAFAGRIVAISPSVDTASNSGMARIRLSNSDGALRLGMFLSAQLPVATHRAALTVDARAIYLDSQGQPRVFRLSGDIATATSVKLGIETPDRDEIISGASDGDSVILTGGYGLGDTAKVKVTSQPAAPAQP
jgi:RND family efflux transporter MFP subunit